MFSSNPNGRGQAPGAPSIRFGGLGTESRNWRVKSKAPPNHHPVSIFLSNPPGRPTIIPKQDIKPGVIIRAPLHQQDYRGAGRESEYTAVVDPNVSKSKYGAVFTKSRKMIVICCYEDHFISIPMFTHNGHGLTYKRNPDEFITVKDHRYPEAFRALSRNGTLVTKALSTAVSKYESMTTAHITFPVARAYNVEATPEGMLESASTQKLIELFDKMGPKPIHR